MSPETFVVFLIATLAVNLSPGPSILYVSSVAAANGFRAALFSVLGMSVGISFHVLAAATGLAALLAASVTAFLIVKYLGAIYLVYLGVRLLLSTTGSNNSSSLPTRTTSWGFFRQGVLVDLLNPKIGMFFIAFLPQFLGPAETGRLLPALALGSVFIVVGGMVNASIGLAVSKGATSIGHAARPWVERWIGDTSGVGRGLDCNDQPASRFA